MTPELQKQIEQEAERYASSKHGYVRDVWKQAYIDGRMVQAARVEELEQQLAFSKHLGEMSDNMAKQTDRRVEELEKEVERLRGALESIQDGAPPITEQQAYSWVDTARDIAQTALNKHNSSIQ